MIERRFKDRLTESTIAAFVLFALLVATAAASDAIPGVSTVNLVEAGAAIFFWFGVCQGTLYLMGKWLFQLREAPQILSEVKEEQKIGRERDDRFNQQLQALKQENKLQLNAVVNEFRQGLILINTQASEREYKMLEKLAEISVKVGERN